jgi:Cupredoxin-like domain
MTCRRNDQGSMMRMNVALFRPIVVVLTLAATISAAAIRSRAQQPAAIEIAVTSHRFQPPQVHAPANLPLTLRVRNLDAAAMEFESVSLRVEKVVAPGSEGIIHVRPLAPGRYEFYDDLHQETRGILVVQ